MNSFLSLFILTSFFDKWMEIEPDWLFTIIPAKWYYHSHFELYSQKTAFLCSLSTAYIFYYYLRWGEIISFLKRFNTFLYALKMLTLCWLVKWCKTFSGYIDIALEMLKLRWLLSWLMICVWYSFKSIIQLKENYVFVVSTCWLNFYAFNWKLVNNLK